MRLIAGITLGLVLSTAALAEDAPVRPTQFPDRIVSSTDEPLGAPYHTVEPRLLNSTDTTLVPLRDYLSSRIDQLRSEMIDRLGQSEKQLRDLADERDRQYAQRFDAQQQAVASALQAVKEGNANALASAKEAVIKAEDASNKRFDSVNEFRNTLTDQAKLFLPAGEADVRFKALEDKVAVVQSQLEANKNINEGANNLWAVIAVVIGVLVALATVYYMARQDHQPRSPAK